MMIADGFLSRVASTVVGGAILTFLFFLAKEKVFPLPTIRGRWYFETVVAETSYEPFSGMVLRYIAMIWQEGPVIRGTIEKFYERSSTGEREYVGKNRTRGIIEGFVHKYYFSKDELHMHIVEGGEARPSTVFFRLTCDTASELSGEFYSTAADQAGTVRWQRKAFTGQ
jgi:hypothetical protein